MSSSTERSSRTWPAIRPRIASPWTPTSPSRPRKSRSSDGTAGSSISASTSPPGPVWERPSASTKSPGRSSPASGGFTTTSRPGGNSTISSSGDSSASSPRAEARTGCSAWLSRPGVPGLKSTPPRTWPMPRGKSLPASEADSGIRKSVDKTEARFIPPFLRLNRHFNRPAASLIIRAVHRTRITPNQLTCLSFLSGLGAAFIFFQGRPRLFLVAGVLAQLASIIDCADGMLARVRGQASR
ncbi:MAG: hypothetical protein FJY82_08110, partial [Candidatus Aminicenantes bacterium]|nr:hypothetical protein [Candidatus Aminicenantes bacterium]